MSSPTHTQGVVDTDSGGRVTCGGVWDVCRGGGYGERLGRGCGD